MGRGEWVASDCDLLSRITTLISIKELVIDHTND